VDPITAFAVKVAGDVLAGVLTDSFSGQRGFRNRQLRRDAVSRVEKHSSKLSQDDLDYVVTRVLSEVRYLADQHPDIKLTRSGVTVLPEVPRSVTDHAGLAREDVRARLDRLGRIVAIRRSELEVAPVPANPESPTDPEPLSRDQEPLPPPPDPSDIPVKRVTTERDSEYWKHKLGDLEAGVRARHEGLNED
jgi:hypothetical protein